MGITPATTSKQQQTDALKRIFPGRTLDYEGNGAKLSIEVRPLMVKQAKDFFGMLTALAEGRMKSDDLRDAILPLINDCCSINIFDSELPHTVLAEIVDAWMEESFGSEDKIRPWLRPVEKLMTRATGRKWDGFQKLSRFWSATATAIETSSNGGAGPSSASGAENVSETMAGD